jgi:hypothetical protein
MKQKKDGLQCDPSRPFTLEDTFVTCVLGSHEILASDYNAKLITVFGTSNVLPYSPAFAININNIHADEPAIWLLRVTYNPDPDYLNVDFEIEWISWPLTAETPEPGPGTIHFSVPLIFGLVQRYEAVAIKFSKAWEVPKNGDPFVSIAFKAYDVDGNLVYIGNITSEFPFRIMESNYLP